MALAFPENIPSWAKVGAQWAIIGGAVTFAYARLDMAVAVGYSRLDVAVNKALDLGANMNTQLVGTNTQLSEINKKIETLDVDRDRISRLQQDVIDLRTEYRNWRDLINRERAATRPAP